MQLSESKNKALDAALASIDVTFSPEREKINKRVNSLIKITHLLAKNNDKANSVAEKLLKELGISEDNLKSEIDKMLKSEIKAGKDEKLFNNFNIRNLEVISKIINESDHSEQEARISFKEFIEESIESNKETFDIGKGLEGQELKDALAKAVKKCKHDHRGVKYNKETGKVTYT